MIGGSLVTAYALLLGANDFHLARLSGLGAFATLGSLLSAYWVGHLGHRKGLVVWGMTLSRIIWGVLGLIFFAVGGGQTRIVLFMGLAAVAACLIQLSNNAWMSWMTDLVPLGRRGRYFSVRNTLLGLVSQAAVLGSAKAIDIFKARGQQPMGFLVIFAGCRRWRCFPVGSSPGSGNHRRTAKVPCRLCGCCACRLPTRVSGTCCCSSCSGASRSAFPARSGTRTCTRI